MTKIKDLIKSNKTEVVTATPVKNAVPITLNSDQFFTLIISATMIAHILHLQADSFAVHKALNKFYDDIDENADALIEAYQGATDSIVNYDLSCLSDWYMLEKSPLEYLRGLKKAINDNRYDVIPRDMSNIHNELDNFITTIDSAVYKITFLK